MSAKRVSCLSSDRCLLRCVAQWKDCTLVRGNGNLRNRGDHGFPTFIWLRVSHGPNVAKHGPKTELPEERDRDGRLYRLRTYKELDLSLDKCHGSIHSHEACDLSQGGSRSRNTATSAWLMEAGSLTVGYWLVVSLRRVGRLAWNWRCAAQRQRVSD